jgi:hypothetical protein
MDDWCFGFWVVAVAISTALCYLAAKHLESGQSRVAIGSSFSIGL